MPNVVARSIFVPFTNNIGVGLQTRGRAIALIKAHRFERYSGKELPPGVRGGACSGFTATVPLALYSDSEGTLRTPKIPSGPPESPSDRRPTARHDPRGPSMIAWMCFQPFFLSRLLRRGQDGTGMPSCRSNCGGTGTECGVWTIFFPLRRFNCWLRRGGGGGGAEGRPWECMSPNRRGGCSLR